MVPPEQQVPPGLQELGRQLRHHRVLHVHLDHHDRRQEQLPEPPREQPPERPRLRLPLQQDSQLAPRHQRPVLLRVQRHHGHHRHHRLGLRRR